jgi:hypothetical protein
MIRGLCSAKRAIETSRFGRRRALSADPLV